MSTPRSFSVIALLVGFTVLAGESPRRSRAPEASDGTSSSIRVRVRSEPTLRSVADAIVRVRPVDGDAADIEARTETRTSASGTAIVRSDAWNSVELTVLAVGHQGQRRTVELGSVDEVLFELDELASLRGSVCDGGGAPVPGARVAILDIVRNSATGLRKPRPHHALLLATELWHPDDRARLELPVTVADGRGAFAYPCLPVGIEIDLVARCDDNGSVKAAVSELSPGEPRAVELRLKPFSGVAGSIATSGTSSRVHLFHYAPDRAASIAEGATRVGTQGRFSFRDVEPGAKCVVAVSRSDAGHEVAFAAADVVEGRVADVGELRPLESELSVELRLPDLVGDRDVHCHLTIRAFPRSGPVACVPFQILAKTDGQVRITGLPPSWVTIQGRVLERIGRQHRPVEQLEHARVRFEYTGEPEARTLAFARSASSTDGR